MLERTFRRHGAIHVGVPVLMPKCALYDANDAYVCLMDRSGALVALPYDSRVTSYRNSSSFMTCFVLLSLTIMSAVEQMWVTLRQQVKVLISYINSSYFVT